MRISAEERIQILFEIAMSISSDLPLNLVIKGSLSTYLRKLNCIAGAILKEEKKGKIQIYNKWFTAIYVIPRNLMRDDTFISFIQRFSDSFSVNKTKPLVTVLPFHSQDLKNNFFYIMELPNFGLLFLIKRGYPLDSAILRSLKPVNLQLAGAFIASLTRDQLIESENRYSTIINTMTDGIIVTDLKKRITFVNPATELLLGYSSAELNQRLVTDFVAPHSTEFLEKELLKRYSGEVESSVYELTFIRKDGSFLDTRVAGITIKQHDKIIGSFGLLTDITAQRELEKRRSDFISMTAHELRTPLTVIQ